MTKFMTVLLFLLSGVSLSAAVDFRDSLAAVSRQTALEIESTYNVTPCGFGSGALFGVELVYLSFDVKRPLAIDEARAMVLGSLAIYEKALNSNKAIRPYLEEYPFPPERIKLAFFVQNSASDLKLVSLTPRGEGVATITYSNKDDNNHLEPYSEAKERLNEK